MTTADKLNAIIDSKENIKGAIEEKGVTVGSVPLSQYANKIEEIKTGADISDGFLIKSDNNKLTAFVYSSDGKIIRGLEGASEIEDIVIMSPITELSNSCFKGTGITSFNIPEGVTYMSSGCFNGCLSLSTITFPNTLGNIGYSALNGCRSLERIDGTESIKTIDQFSMAFCSNLEYVSLPGARTIDNRAFRDCFRLIEVTLGSPSNPVSSIHSYAFGSMDTEFSLNIYVEDPNNPKITGAPWSALGATITYLQA